MTDAIYNESDEFIDLAGLEQIFVDLEIFKVPERSKARKGKAEKNPKEGTAKKNGSR